MIGGEIRFLPLMHGLPCFFAPLDWLVFAGLLVFLFLVPGFVRVYRRKAGEASEGVAGALAWPAAGLALVANEWGGTALVAIPALVTASQGNLTLLPWAAGAWLARGILSWCLLGPIWREGGGDPFVFIGERLGTGTRRLAECLAFIGSLIVQSLSVVALAMLLMLLTTWSLPAAMGVSAGAAILWGFSGAARGVGWDLVLFGLAIAAAGGSLFLLVSGWNGGWEEIRHIVASVETFDGRIIEKLGYLDLGTDPRMGTTFWIALFAVPFLSLQTLGAGALTRRTLARCRGLREARLAVLVSALSPVFVFLLLLLGVVLFAFHTDQPPTDPSILRALEWSGGGPGAPWRVLPVWILTEASAGWKGALLGAIAASTFLGLGNCVTAGASCLGSSGRGGPSRYLPFATGVILAASVIVAIILPGPAAQEPSFAALLRAMSWCCGPLLGVLFLSLSGRCRPAGVFAGTIASLLLVAYANPGCWVHGLDGKTAASIASWPGYEPSGDEVGTFQFFLATEWLWPLTTLVTVSSGWKYSRSVGSKN